MHQILAKIISVPIFQVEKKFMAKAINALASRKIIVALIFLTDHLLKYLLKFKFHASLTIHNERLKNRFYFPLDAILRFIQRNTCAVHFRPILL